MPGITRRHIATVLACLPLAAALSACRREATTEPLPPAEPADAAQPGGAPDVEAPAAAAALTPGDSTHSLTYAGVERTYILHMPPGYDEARSTPLVLAFHGISLNADEMVRISGLSRQADTSGFIVAYPNGTGEAKSWNGGHCCGEAAKERVDDVGFTAALIDDLAGLANVDSDRVYATGFSNGAIFVYRLACELSERIAAVGPVAATQVRNDQEECQPSRPVPIIHFHGTADRLNPYEGATTAAGYEFLSVEDAMAFWADANGCSTPTRTESGSILRDVYAACAQGAAIELYTIVDGEHAWPGGEAVSPQVGEPNMEINASALMWAFFAAHPMP